MEDGELFDVGFEEGGESAHPEHALVEGFPGVGFGGGSRRGLGLAAESFGREGVKAAEEDAGRGVEGLDHK